MVTLVRKTVTLVVSRWVLPAAAAVWTRRAVVLDTIGGAALVVAAALVAAPAGWAVAGVWLTLRAFGIERRR